MRLFRRWFEMAAFGDSIASGESAEARAMRKWRATTFGTDKGEAYMRHYCRHFGALMEQPIRLLELGIHEGGSLKMWLELFPNATVAGLDLNPPAMPQHPRLRVYAGDQSDERLLDRIAGEVAPDGFDIVIDDASHMGRPSRVSFANLFARHLKPGGIYVLEDWGTGYWPKWPDGQRFKGDTSADAIVRSDDSRPHAAGMVGLVKDLVDEVGIADVTHPTHGGAGAPRRSRIERLEIVPGLAFAFKAADAA